MPPSPDRSASSSTREYLLPILVAAYLLGLALLTTPSAYSLADLMMIAFVYLLVSVGVVGIGQLMRSFGTFPGVLGDLFVAGVMVWHFREQTRASGTPSTLWRLGPLATFLGAIVLVALIYAVVQRLLVREPGRFRYGVATVAAWLGVVAMVTVSYHASTTLRWHLLRHNNLIGVPAYHALAPDVHEVSEELWARHRDEPGTAAAPSPAKDLGTPLAGGDAGSEGSAVVEAGGEPATPGGEAADPLPDILYVLVDTLRADGLAAYGGDPELMPALNGFADRSFVFGDVLANTSWTRPSVATFMTGLLPEEHGAATWGYLLPPQRITLAEVLSARGYETAAIVANRVVNPDAAFDQGFDVFSNVDPGDDDYPRAAAINREVTRFLEQRHAGPGDAGDNRDRGGTAGTDDGDADGNGSERVGDDEGGDGSKLEPLFLYVHYLDPHTPYLSGGEKHADSDADATEGYDNELRYLDGYLEEIFQIAEQELRSPTVVFFTADHGEELGEHGDRGHGHTLYDEVIEVPALVRILGGADSGLAGYLSQPLEARDFFHLIPRLADDPQLDIPSWAEEQRREQRYSSLYNEKDDALSMHILRPFRSGICMRRLDEAGVSLIWSAYGPTLELYDLGTDHAQLVNLAGARPDAVDRMMAMLEGSVAYWAHRIPADLSRADLENLRALGYVR